VTKAVEQVGCGERPQNILGFRCLEQNQRFRALTKADETTWGRDDDGTDAIAQLGLQSTRTRQATRTERKRGGVAVGSGAAIPCGQQDLQCNFTGSEKIRMQRVPRRLITS